MWVSRDVIKAWEVVEKQQQQLYDAEVEMEGLVEEMWRQINRQSKSERFYQAQVKELDLRELLHQYHQASVKARIERLRQVDANLLEIRQLLRQLEALNLPAEAPELLEARELLEAMEQSKVLLEAQRPLLEALEKTLETREQPEAREQTLETREQPEAREKTLETREQALEAREKLEALELEAREKSKSRGAHQLQLHPQQAEGAQEQQGRAPGKEQAQERPRELLEAREPLGAREKGTPPAKEHAKGRAWESLMLLIGVCTCGWACSSPFLQLVTCVAMDWRRLQVWPWGGQSVVLALPASHSCIQVWHREVAESDAHCLHLSFVYEFL